MKQKTTKKKNSATKKIFSRKKLAFTCLLAFCLVSTQNTASATIKEEFYYHPGKANHWAINENTPPGTFPVAWPGNDPIGATINEVSDSGKTVLETFSPNGTNGTQNSYELRAFPASDGTCVTQYYTPRNSFAPEIGCWENEQQTILSFDVKSSGPFAVYVHLRTSKTRTSVSDYTYNNYNKGMRIIKYTSDDINTAGAETDWNAEEREYYSSYYYFNDPDGSETSTRSFSQGKTLHYGIGSDKSDGNWHTVTRDIKQDLKNLQSTNNIDIDGIRKIEVQGNVRIGKVSLDFTNEEFEKMDGFQKDHDWSYDTGWLQTHHHGGNSPADKIVCDSSGKTGWRPNECDGDVRYDQCKYIFARTDAKFYFDASDLPANTMDDCYVTMNNMYTFDESMQGYQPDEIALISVTTPSNKETSVILPDPGEGRHQLTASEPITLERGLNTFYLRPPGFCGRGNSVHFGRGTKKVRYSHGIETAALDAFRIKCGPKNDALTLEMKAKDNPIPVNSATEIFWKSDNAKTCIPSAGFFNGTANDWQNMSSVWSDLETGNPSWPQFSTFPPPSTIYPSTPFTTNPLPGSASYTLTCSNKNNTQKITKTVMLGVTNNVNNPDCQDFDWDRVESRNDSPSSTGDPAGHPPNIYHLDVNGNPIPAPAATDFQPLYNLPAGGYSLILKTRERLALSDKIIVTNDLTFNPGADPNDPKGEKAVASGKEKIEIESESCRINHVRIKAIQNHTASGYQAIQFENYYSTDTPRPSDEMYYYIECDLDIPAGASNDQYAVWGRNGVGFGRAADGWSDSVWFGITQRGVEHTANDLVLWDFESPVIETHCLDLDLWAGTTGTTDRALGSTSLTINLGDELHLFWATGGVQTAFGTMNNDPSYSYDPDWDQIKDSTSTPPYHSQQMYPLAEGTYVYQLQGIYEDIYKTEIKEVAITVGSGALPPPDFNGQCGQACHESHCTEPTTDLCVFPSTLQSPPGVQPKAGGGGWQWICSGTGTGSPSPTCEVTQNCGWIEK